MSAGYAAWGGMIEQYQRRVKVRNIALRPVRPRRAHGMFGKTSTSTTKTSEHCELLPSGRCALGVRTGRAHSLREAGAERNPIVIGSPVRLGAREACPSKGASASDV